MRRFLRVMGAVAVGAGVCVGQMGPPVWPVGARKTAAGPWVAGVGAPAEAAAADPSVLVAGEPMENFGVARYRLEDYAECAGTGGCYWADVDAQAKRAEVALDGLVAKRKAGERIALVLD